MFLINELFHLQLLQPLNKLQNNQKSDVLINTHINVLENRFHKNEKKAQDIKEFLSAHHQNQALVLSYQLFHKFLILLKHNILDISSLYFLRAIHITFLNP